MVEETDRDRIDWSLTTWEGSRREQIERWTKLTFDEILDTQEEMAELAQELAGPKGSGPIAAGAHGDRASEPPTV